jgi:hypothetical protein
MKRNENKRFALTGIVKVFVRAVNRLFFTDDNRDFQRLKNFLAS